MSETEFNKILLEAIDKGLSSIGDSSKQAIYFHLERVFNINRQEIPDKLADFQDALEKIFGLGAQFLEIIIMRRLYEKIGHSIQLEGTADFSFTEYVAAVKRSFMEKRKLRARSGLIHAAKIRTLLFSRGSESDG